MRNHAEVKVNKYLFTLVLEILFFKSYFRSHLSPCHASNRAAISALHTHRVSGAKLYWKVQWKGNVTATVPKAAGLVTSNFCQVVPELLTLQRAVSSVQWCGSPLFSHGAWLNSAVRSWFSQSWGKMPTTWSGNGVLSVRSWLSYLSCMVCLEGNFLADLLPSGSKVISRFRPALKVI